MISTSQILNLTDSTLVRAFVKADCGRGTIDILWSCLTAIFLSVWTVIHLSVPCFDIERPDNFRRKIVRSRMGTCMMCLLAPEFLLYLALDELMLSYQVKQELQLLSTNPSLAHAFFVKMGGFCLQSRTRRHQLRTVDIQTATQDGKLSHAKEWIEGLKRTDKSQLDDLAKSDSITKVFACIQGLWVLTQAITRIYQHQALSLLEVTASAYICCAVAIYGFWWSKPQNCSVPLMIPCSEEAIAELSGSAYEDKIDTREEYMWAGQDVFADMVLNITLTASARLLYGGASIFAFTAFGAIHVASWHETLPSTVELWIWRASSLYCLVYTSVLALSIVAVIDKYQRRFGDILDRCMVAGMPIYTIVRTYMLVEVFISLRALPASAFHSTQWPSFVPHI